VKETKTYKRFHENFAAEFPLVYKTYFEKLTVGYITRMVLIG